MTLTILSCIAVLAQADCTAATAVNVDTIQVGEDDPMCSHGREQTATMPEDVETGEDVYIKLVCP
jgi:hypothetical protein